MQNYGGREERPAIDVLRNDNRSHIWRSIDNGLPFDLEFPIAVHPHITDTDDATTLEPATRTYRKEAPAAWRSENGGNCWQRGARGVPKKKQFCTVLSDAITVNTGKSPTFTAEQRLARFDSGTTAAKTCLFNLLPAIPCVKIATVGVNPATIAIITNQQEETKPCIIISEWQL